MSLWSQLVEKHEYTGVPIGNICFGIPTINRKDLLEGCLNDIASHIGNIPLCKLVIVDNGNQNIASIIPPSLEDKTIIFSESRNLGVAGSWNKIMRVGFNDCMASHTLLINDDIALGQAFCNNYVKTLEDYPDACIINSGYFWSCVTLTKRCWDNVGQFDENFFPAYFEDNDYHTRLKLYETHTGESLYIHDNRLEPGIKRNSQSVSRDGSLNSKYSANSRYYTEKWGSGPKSPRFKSPFNKGGETPWKL